MDFLKRIWWGWAIASIGTSGVVASAAWALLDETNRLLSLFVTALIAFWIGGAIWDLWYRDRAPN